MDKEKLRKQLESYLRITFGRFYQAKEKTNFFSEADEILKFPVLKECLEMVDKLVEALERIVTEPGYYPEYLPIKRGREVLAKVKEILNGS